MDDIPVFAVKLLNSLLDLAFAKSRIDLLVYPFDFCLYFWIQHDYLLVLLWG